MAEAQDSLDVSELKDHFLECSVCLEHFDQAERRPRLLVNCLHSFCSQCLEQLLKKEGRGQVTCPNCRQVQKVKGNAQSLPIDPVRNKLVDYVKFKKGKQIPCTDCPDGSHAVARCHECQIYMCAPCKEAHHRNRSTRKHTCQSLKEALSEPVKNFLSHRCEDHPDYKIEFFCQQCSSLCCVSCPIVKHKGHDLDPIEDAANSMLSSLKTKMEEVEKSASVLRRKKTSLKEKSIVQKVDLKHTTTSINKTFDELIGKFNCQRNKLITKLKERTESTVNSLEKQLEATEDSLAQMESTLEYFKQMESKSDDCEVLSAGPALVQSLEAAAAVDQTQDVQHPTWTFSPGEMNNVVSMVQRTGEIHSDTIGNLMTSPTLMRENMLANCTCYLRKTSHGAPHHTFHYKQVHHSLTEKFETSSQGKGTSSINFQGKKFFNTKEEPGQFGMGVRKERADQQSVTPYAMRWFYLDPEDDDLEEYDDVISRKMEESYVKGKKEHKLPMDDNFEQYIVDFGAMEEYREKNREDSMMVLRREVVREVPEFNPPRSWVPMDGKQLKVQMITTAEKEYENILQRIEDSVGSRRVTVLKIEQIQNVKTRERFEEKKQMLRRRGETDDEEELWFKCTKADNIVPINHWGISVTFTKGQHDSPLGEGVEFSRSFTDVVERGVKENQYAYLCNVLVGKYTKGKMGIRDPPCVAANESHFYNSVVDNVAKPSKYLVFSDAQIEPVYLVTFKLQA